MKSKYWYYRFPGSGLIALDKRFDKPVTEKEAREEIRRIWKQKRLPKGFEIWIGLGRKKIDS